MAEINPSGGKTPAKGAGVKKGKKLSTRVDLTPMVDLGFLLITFFIFTATMSQATAMKLYLPADSDDPTPTPATKTLTFLLAAHNNVYYYEGLLDGDGANLKLSSFTGMRDLILRCRKRLHDPKDLMVIIKPNNDALYKNAVDALDEMTINDVRRYAMVDVSELESQFVKRAERTVNP